MKAASAGLDAADPLLVSPTVLRGRVFVPQDLLDHLAEKHSDRQAGSHWDSHRLVRQDNDDVAAVRRLHHAAQLLLALEPGLVRIRTTGSAIGTVKRDGDSHRDQPPWLENRCGSLRGQHKLILATRPNQSTTRRHRCSTSPRFLCKMQEKRSKPQE